MARWNTPPKSSVAPVKIVMCARFADRPRSPNATVIIRLRAERPSRGTSIVRPLRLSTLGYDWFMITPPEPTEYQSYYGRYISLVPGRDLTQTLNSQLAQSQPILSAIDEQKSLYRYAPGKWSIKEMLGHLVDAERIFTYRALRFARR